MLKVASVIPSLATRCGGPIINLVDSVAHLRTAGVEVTIFTTDMGAPATARPRRLAEEDLPSGATDCDIRIFRTQRPARVAYSPGLKKALRTDLKQFDLVRIHGLFLHPQYAAASEAQRGGTPYVVTPHGALDPWVRRRGRVRKIATGITWQNRMLRRAAVIQATTAAEAELFSDVLPRGTAHCVVPNGLATARFGLLPRRGGLRGELGIPTDTPLVLFHGRVSRKKGIDVLVRALAEMWHRDAVLVIIGPDDENLTPGLQRLATHLSVAERTYFAGPRYGDRRLAALADADVWALPSHSENFGNAVLEAMAAGLPTVVSTAVNLAPEILAARAGYVEPCDASAFAAACDSLLDSPGERIRLVSAGQTFAAGYDWPKVSLRLAAMFAEFAR